MFPGDSDKQHVLMLVQRDESELTLLVAITKPTATKAKYNLNSSGRRSGVVHWLQAADMDSPPFGATVVAPPFRHIYIYIH